MDYVTAAEAARQEGKSVASDPRAYLFRAFVGCIGRRRRFARKNVLHRRGLRPRPRPFCFPVTNRGVSDSHTHYRHHMKLYTLVCAASFTVCAYSCDRMPFSSAFLVHLRHRAEERIDRQDTGILSFESLRLSFDTGKLAV